jgi:chromosome segregation ATPase
VLVLAACASGPETTVQRDLGQLRQEMAALTAEVQAGRRANEGRLERLELDLGRRYGSGLKESEDSRAAIHLRIEELVRETRFVQGKLEENALALDELSRRLDSTESHVDVAMRKLESLEQQPRVGSAGPRASGFDSQSVRPTAPDAARLSQSPAAPAPSATAPR